MAAQLKSSRTLIDNWVEEVGSVTLGTLVCAPKSSRSLQRQCAHLEDGTDRNPDGTLSSKLHRYGHKVTGVLAAVPLYTNHAVYPNNVISIGVSDS